MKAPTINARIIALPLVRRGFKGLKLRYYALKLGEGLLIERHSDNPGNALLLLKENLKPVGYVDRASASIVAPWIDKGWIYTCRVIQSAKTSQGSEAIILYDGSVIVKLEPIAPLKKSTRVIDSVPVPA